MSEIFDFEQMPEAKTLSEEEGRAIFEKHTQELFGLTTEEFLQAYDSGEITLSHEDPRHSEIVRVWMLIPLVR